MGPQDRLFTEQDVRGTLHRFLLRLCMNQLAGAIAFGLIALEVLVANSHGHRIRVCEHGASSARRSGHRDAVSPTVRARAIIGRVSSLHRAFTAVLAVLTLALVNVGCGGTAELGRARADPGGAAPPDAATSRTAVDASFGSGRAGNTSQEGGALTEHAACVRYFTAECNRKFYECEGLPAVADPCPDITDACPDMVFSEGSGRSMADVLACADVWRTFPCDQVVREQFPTCAVAGNRAAGQACLYGSQCASNRCSLRASDADHPDCGICALVGAPGAECDEAHGMTCENGYECGVTGLCVKEPEFGLPRGALCERWGACLGTDVCFPDPNDPSHPMKCQALPALGDPCPTVNVCQPGAFCTQDRRCEALPTVGMTCASAALGEGITPECSPDTWCARTPDRPLCSKRATRGGACDAQPGKLVVDRCVSGLVCACLDSGCLAGTCVEKTAEGAACGEPHTVCSLGTSCQGGVCVASGLQGTFRGACGE